MTTILNVIYIIIAVALIISVLLQSSKSAGLSGAISGGAETSFGKKKGMDEVISKITTYLAIFFMVSALLLSVVIV